MSMLKDKISSAIVAVSDVERARAFYGDTLGLELVDDGMGGVLGYRTGSTYLMVYPSDYAGTNKANAVVWDCGEDIEAIVAELEGKGVQFERYDMEGVEHDGAIHRFGDFRTAWFKDPDGNILHLTSA